MARIEWVEHRLDNWAAWYVTTDGFTRKVLGEASPEISESALKHWTQRPDWLPPLSIDAQCAQVTNTFIRKLLDNASNQDKSFMFVYMFHVEGMGVKKASIGSKRPDSYYHEALEQLDRQLAAMFVDYQISNPPQRTRAGLALGSHAGFYRASQDGMDAVAFIKSGMPTAATVGIPSDNRANLSPGAGTESDGLI